MRVDRDPDWEKENWDRVRLCEANPEWAAKRIAELEAIVSGKTMYDAGELARREAFEQAAAMARQARRLHSTYVGNRSGLESLADALEAKAKEAGDDALR